MLLSFCSITAWGQSHVIDSLQHIVELHRQDSVELQALLNLTNEYLRSDLGKATSYAHRSRHLAQHLNNAPLLGGSYVYLAGAHQNAGNADSALYYLDLLQAVLDSHADNKSLKANFNQAAGLFYKNQGQYRKALPYMLTSLSLITSETEGRAGQYLNIGNVYFLLSDYANAVSNHLQALRIFEKVSNKRGQSFCFQGLAKDFQNMGQFEQSKQYFLQSLKLKQELHDKRGIITASNGLASAYMGLGQTALAEKFYTDAIKGAHEMNLVSDEALGRLELGLLYKSMGDLTRARESISGSLTLSTQQGDSTMIAKAHSALIGLDMHEQETNSAEAALINNIRTIIKSGDKSAESAEYARLSDYYAHRKDFEKAFLYLKKHGAIKDSVEGSDILFQIKKLEETFQSEKREKEIQLLRKDQELHTLELARERNNVIMITIALASVIVISILLINRFRIVSRHRRDIELEKMRNHIARDLHDDIGSTLSSINIISQLALNGDTGRHLQQITFHSSQMMENMSDIVWSINPKNDTIEQVLLKMKEFAVEILEPKGISHSFEVDDAILSLKLEVEKRKNLFLIFKEAVNNAAKYSKGREVLTSLKVKAKTFHLSIADNGKGFDMAETSRGNGLINMQERAASIGGKLHQISQPGQGTTLELEIPIT